MKKLKVKEMEAGFNINSNQSITERIINILNQHYCFRYNVVTGRNEWKLKREVEFKELEERHFNSIWIDLDKTGISTRAEIADRVINSDFVPEYDPFNEYFSNLTWDGNTDYIDRLANTVTTTNQEFWKRAFRKWIVAVVACAISDNENHEALVFSGAQGIGKTTWLSNLLPGKLERYMYSGTINPHSKDTLINLAETLFINLDELENLNRIEHGNMREVLTKKNIRQRRPYEKYHKIYERRASFMGSVNDMEFLTDITGNRRYLCFLVEKIENHEINMDDVFGQAYHIFKNGQDGKPFRYWFEGEDIAEIDRYNKQFLRMSLEEELVRKYFEVPKSTEGYTFMTPTEIIYHITSHEGMALLDKSSLKRLGQVMQKMGFRKKSTVDSKPYAVIVKTTLKKSPVFKTSA